MTATPYPALILGEAPPSRPYVVINMVATIDGKTITGERDEHVMDLGSSVDHAAMREIQSAVEAVMLGAGSLRAVPKLWYPAELFRFVATRSGNFDASWRFFSDAPSKAFLVGPRSLASESCACITAGDFETDWHAILWQIRERLGVQRLLVEGGSTLNAELLRAGLVDEIFLTVAPKVKLGATTPTIAGGVPLTRDQVQDWELVSCQPIGNEVFLRYRRIVTVHSMEER